MKIGNIEVYGVIYKITNTINKKCYIGQTVNGFKKRYDYKGKGIERVYNYHCAFRKYGEKYNDHIIKSVEKYGFDCWEVIEIYDIAFSKEELDIKEKHYIKLFNATDRRFGYNNNEGGANGKPTDEVRKKYSEAKLGKNKGKNNPNSKQVVCITTNKIFDCIAEASAFYNCNRHGIIKCCKNEDKSAGKLPDGTKLVWRYYKDYLNMTSGEIQEVIECARNCRKGKYAHQAKRVICITTNKIFETAKEAGMYYNVSNSSIIACCRDRAKSAGKYNNEKLIWKYAEN